MTDEELNAELNFQDMDNEKQITRAEQTQLELVKRTKDGCPTDSPAMKLLENQYRDALNKYEKGLIRRDELETEKERRQKK